MIVIINKICYCYIYLVVYIIVSVMHDHTNVKRIGGLLLGKLPLLLPEVSVHCNNRLRISEQLTRSRPLTAQTLLYRPEDFLSGRMQG